MPSFIQRRLAGEKRVLRGGIQGSVADQLDEFLPSGGKNPSDPCPSMIEAFSKGQFLTGVTRSTRTTRCSVRGM